jgi:hypothetical protein
MRFFPHPQDYLFHRLSLLKKMERAITAVSSCVNTWLRESYKGIKCGLEVWERHGGEVFLVLRNRRKLRESQPTQSRKWKRK